MKIKKNIVIGVLFFLITQILCTCGNPSGNRTNQVHVGVLYYDQSDTYLNELIAIFKNQLKEQAKENIETSMTIKGASGSQRTQNDQVRELIESGCNVLCVNLVDRADPSEIIDLAKESDVPIIFFNREPVDEDMQQWDKLYYVGADAKQSGVMQGELAADVIKADKRIDRNNDGKIQYVVLEGEPGHQDAIIRTENAVETLKNQGISLEKLGYQIANWNRAQAQNRMEQMISKYRNQIELVLANNDEMALGAKDAYLKLNYTEATLPKFFGIDGTKEGIEAVANASLAGTVYNDKEGQAEAMAKLSIALVSGSGMDAISFVNDRYIYLPYYKVTADTIDSFKEK